MGRSSYSDRLFADGLKKISIFWLKEYGYLKGFKKGVSIWRDSYNGAESRVGVVVQMNAPNSYLQLRYRFTNDYGDVEKFDYRVYLTETKCYFGGVRYWFMCPLRPKGFCSKRVGTLYLVGTYFGCRHCYDLTYACRNENRRSKFRALTVFRKLGDKVDELEMSLKRSIYAGRPTKKQKRVDHLRHELGMTLLR